ncbi:putative F-box domain, galactose oxidase/kelch, beta-propeller, F-box associated interaction [Rosa chinensis]|uniref:Putative F-box domain, galactose oxidase/kelch, beta-propeller, F-box associated interaction n=1 Tax=Rosa chinensis TaxID=74649 RepID=A0A2P6QVY8_ROSCH|nr:F-box/kelch-repeat protein At3g23880 [Rosa chinensis]XP_040373786.1 F-box/kelch-repeat protein At3g23880 [Rosa chinensis]PRQ38345.1 putative F-box domain, galactose oxidase/kelch, beta-propeller, F-box associated interaction [Rosa chinensis]
MKKTKVSHSHRTSNTDIPPNQEDEVEEEHHILRLPNRIVLEFFCKIPTKWLAQCKCVCKSWRRLLSDPHFTKSLLSRTPSYLLLRDTCYLKSLVIFDFEKASDRNMFEFWDRPKTEDDCLTKLSGDRNALISGQVIGSCNGFLCIYNDWPNPWRLYIYNPITGESLTLPTPEMKCSFLCGLGYSPISDVYKVVMFKYPSEGPNNKREVKVMTVGSGVWRTIGDLRFNVLGDADTNGVYLNGFLHWIGESCTDSVSIFAFDVENECFQELPPHPSALKIKNIEIFNGWLSIFLRRRGVISVWVMKDYGVEGSWTKELEIEKASDSRILMSTNKGPVLMLRDWEIHTYDLGTKRYKWVPVNGLPLVFQEIAHTPSFVLLKDIIKG